MTLKDWLADRATAFSQRALDRSKKWLARSDFWADVSEWLQTWKPWAEIRNKRGGQ